MGRTPEQRQTTASTAESSNRWKSAQTKTIKHCKLNDKIYFILEKYNRSQFVHTVQKVSDTNYVCCFYIKKSKSIFTE